MTVEIFKVDTSYSLLFVHVLKIMIFNQCTLDDGEMCRKDDQARTYCCMSIGML